MASSSWALLGSAGTSSLKARFVALGPRDTMVYTPVTDTSCSKLYWQGWGGSIHLILKAEDDNISHE